jgi:DNA polymerase I-like protein with 3'-5' exonuclease and polymerase domains
MKFHYGIEHLDLLEDAELVALDTETTGLQPKAGGLRLIQFAADGQFPVVIDCWQLSDKEWLRLDQFLGQRRRWIAHNATFDLGWLQEHELYPEGSVYCSMLASRILTNGLPNVRHGLQHVVQRYLKKEISKEEQASDWSAPSLRPEQLAYAAYDVQLLLELWEPLLQRLATGQLMAAWELECRALPAVAQMQRTGLPFSREKLEALRDELSEANQRMGAEFVVALDEALPEGAKLPRDPDGALNLRPKATGTVRGGDKMPAGFNISSPHQLKKVFTDLLGEVPVNPATGKPSCSRPALREYVAEHVVVAQYLKWKQVEKRSQMLESLLKHQDPDGFIRASYLQLGADTGRFSCMSPNLQNIPRAESFRSCVEAPEGWVLVDADFAQMELRLAAVEADDEMMARAFREGEDLHRITARAIYGEAFDGADEAEQKKMRQVGKSAAFGLLYGAGAKGLRNYAASSGIQMSLEEATEIRDKFHSLYRGISTWQKKAASAAQNSGANAAVRIRVSDLRRLLPGEHNKLTTRCNTVVQGAGAAVLKLALAKLWKLVFEAGEDEVRIAGAVHDELLCLVREEYADKWTKLLSQVMEEAEAKWLGNVPPLAEAHHGKTWTEAKG